MSLLSRYALLKFKVAAREILALYDERVIYLVPEHFKIALAFPFVLIEKNVLEPIHISLYALGRVIWHLFTGAILLPFDGSVNLRRDLQFGVFEMEGMLFHIHDSTIFYIFPKPEARRRKSKKESAAHSSRKNS